MRAAEADLHALAEGEAGTLRVGTFQSAGVRLLPGAMQRYVERWPGVQVRLVEASYDEALFALLERGELDLAFVLENDDPAFERTNVLSDPYVLLAPTTSELTRSVRPIRPQGDRRAAVDRLPPRDGGCGGLPTLARPRARDRLPLRRRRHRPGPRRRRDRVRRRPAPRCGRELRGGRPRGRRRPAPPDHDRLARRPHAVSGRPRLRRDRRRDRSRDRRGLRSTVRGPLPSRRRRRS